MTNITTKLPWHIKKHEKAERRAANGFKYFTKREECGRLGTALQRQGQGLVAGGGAVALSPEALEAWVTSPGTCLLPSLIRLHVLLNMSQISQARHCQTGKTQNPRVGVWVAWSTVPTLVETPGASSGCLGQDLVLFPFLFKRTFR